MFCWVQVKDHIKKVVVLRKKSWMTLACFIILFQSVSFVLGRLTQEAIPNWYIYLHKSYLTPPGTVFAIVWTVLYLFLAVVAWILFAANQDSFKRCKRLFILQTILNWCWTPLFFTLHALAWSSVCLVLLLLLNAMLLIRSYKLKKIIFWLLLPYVIWLLFACYLSLVITIMN